MSGLAFIFIPISILSYVGVPRNMSNQVSGISNFIRNLGGSVGISMLTTFLARQSQVHQTNLVAHATTANPQFNQMLQGSAANMAKSGSGPALALQQAYNQVMGLIQQQAALLSYVNAFWVGCGDRRLPRPAALPAQEAQARRSPRSRRALIFRS